MSHANLWAPWRMPYLEGLGAESESPSGPQRCFLCEAAATAVGSEEARGRHVLVNDSRGQILLNRYPYTNGHLLAAPAAHVGDLADLAPAARADLFELAHLAECLLRAAMNPQGFNIGINLGRCAGAGVPGHLHVHIVPRWGGDTNFMQTLGQVRVIPQALEQSYALLARTLAGMEA